MNLARKALLILPILFVLAMPLAASADSAAVGSANWHIIPDACKCENSAPDFGCVLQVTQNVMNLGVYLALILMTIAIATAGFLWIFAPISAQNREMAKSTLTNAVIGIVIVLSAWLVVDFVMKKLYGQDNAWGPWNEILHANGGECIRTITSNTAPSNQPPGGVTTAPNQGGQPSSTGTHACTGGGVSFTDSVISAQSGDESGALSSFLSCMRGKVPSGEGRITSISDCQIHGNCPASSGLPARTWDQCLAGQCQHTSSSCHYGGSTGQHKSYAVDFGDENNTNDILAAAKACNSNARWFYEGDHLHVSLGAASGAGCDVNMAQITVAACQ